VQTRIEAENSGLPWISELPYVGVPFRKVNETVNEVELLMLVTPELVEAMDADEVPPCGPGMQTTSPSDCELFLKGHLEVPKCCPGDCGDCRNQRADCLPPEGMIQNPGEKIPTPPAAEGASAVRPRSRYNSSNPTAQATAKSADSSNNPPGFIGPVGYDVVQ